MYSFQITAAEKLKEGVERKLENITQAWELRKTVRSSSQGKTSGMCIIAIINFQMCE